jgi:hypothetical protein
MLAVLVLHTSLVAWSRTPPEPTAVGRRLPPPIACAGSDADGLLVRATEALRAKDAVAAGSLLLEARRAYDEADALTPDRESLLQLVQARINAATATVARSRPRDDLPLEAAERVGGSAAQMAVAARLAAKLGPVAFAPVAVSKEAREAMRRGDGAVSETITALGRKDFVAAYEALEQARSVALQRRPLVNSLSSGAPSLQPTKA